MTPSGNTSSHHCTDSLTPPLWRMELKCISGQFRIPHSTCCGQGSRPSGQTYYYTEGRAAWCSATCQITGSHRSTPECPISRSSCLDRQCHSPLLVFKRTITTSQRSLHRQQDSSDTRPSSLHQVETCTNNRQPG